MIKVIRKLSYILMILFLASIVLILMADKFDWLVNSNFIPVFIIIFALTVLCMLIVSISVILKTIRKVGKLKFCKGFMIKLVFFFAVQCAAAFFKDDKDILIMLGSSVALSIGSYFFEEKSAEPK
ncbi:hypothetical protein V6615_15970 [Oscillospiraceae bacterium PP1C4]